MSAKHYLTFIAGALAAHQTEADATAHNAEKGGDVIINTVEELVASTAINIDPHYITLYNLAAKAVDADAKALKAKDLGKDKAIAGTKLFAALDAAFGTSEAQTASDLAAAVKPEKKARAKKEPKERSGPMGLYAGRFWVVAPREGAPRRPPAERGNPARGYNSMKVIKENPGIMTEQYLEKGGRLRDLDKDYRVNKNILEVVGDEAARAAFVAEQLELRKVEDVKLIAEQKAAAEAKAKLDAEKAAKKAAEDAAKAAAAEKKAADDKAAAEKAAAETATA